MAKTFAKIAKTFARLWTTIIATRRRTVFILHLEAKYAKIDCKNEIYAKNWVRSTWTAKVNSSKKSTVKVNPKSKVNGQSQQWSTVWSTSWLTMTSADDVAMTLANDVAMMTSPRADISKRNLARDNAWGLVTACEGSWWRVERMCSCAEFSGGA